MTTELKGFINVASNNRVTFSNSLKSDLLVFTASNSQRILMGTNQSSNASFVITSNSVIINENLGIGTSNLTARLDVIPTAGQASALRVGTSSGADALVVRGDGRLGVNTPSPSHTLHVQHLISPANAYAFYSFDSSINGNDLHGSTSYGIQTRGTNHAFVSSGDSRNHGQSLKYTNDRTVVTTTYSIVTQKFQTDGAAFPWPGNTTAISGAFSCWFQQQGSTANATWTPHIFWYGFRPTQHAIAAYIANGNVLTIDGANMGATHTASVLPNVWYHLAISFSNGACTVYLNGAVIGSVASGFMLGNASFAPNNFALGTRLAQGTNSSVGPEGVTGWFGMIDEFVVWSRALTAGEVAALANAPWTSDGAIKQNAIQCDGTMTVSGNANVSGFTYMGSTLGVKMYTVTGTSDASGNMSWALPSGVSGSQVVAMYGTIQHGSIIYPISSSTLDTEFTSRVFINLSSQVAFQGTGINTRSKSIRVILIVVP